MSEDKIYLMMYVGGGFGVEDDWYLCYFDVEM